MPSLICPVCSRPVDPSESAVCGFRRDGDWRYWWAPFVEDLRTSPDRIAHPQCYVADNGLDALLALIRTSDEIQRRDAFSMHTTLMELRQQSGSSSRRK